MAQQTMGSFNRETAKELSRHFKEPSWLEEFRLKAFEEYSSQPVEKNTLYTKYAGI